jgi:hypothetical protein
MYSYYVKFEEKKSNMLEKSRKLLISSDYLFQLIWTSYGVDRPVLVSNAFGRGLG